VLRSNAALGDESDSRTKMFLLRFVPLLAREVNHDRTQFR
jgi:hypothetical protein